MKHPTPAVGPLLTTTGVAVYGPPSWAPIVSQRAYPGRRLARGGPALARVRDGWNAVTAQGGAPAETVPDLSGGWLRSIRTVRKFDGTAQHYLRPALTAGGQSMVIPATPEFNSGGRNAVRSKQACEPYIVSSAPHAEGTAAGHPILIPPRSSFSNPRRGAEWCVKARRRRIHMMDADTPTS